MALKIAILGYGQLTREEIAPQEQQIINQAIEDMGRTINMLARAEIAPVEDFGPMDPLHRAWIWGSLGDDTQASDPFPITFMTHGKAPDSEHWLEGEQVSLPDFDLEIAKGLIARHSVVHKFGSRVVDSTVEVPADVWDGPRQNYPWPVAGAPLYAVSSNPVDTGIPVRFQGLDAALGVQNLIVNLNGQTPVPIEDTGGEVWRRIHRAYVVGGTETQGQVYVFAGNPADVTAGVPDNLNLVGAVIDPLHQQTQMTMFTVPAGYVGYLQNWAASVNRATTTGVKEADLILQIREPGGVFRTQEFFTPNNQGTGIAQIQYKPPRKLEAGTDIRVRVSAISTNATEVSSFYDLILVQDEE